MKRNVEVIFWVVAACGVVAGNQHFAVDASASVRTSTLKIEAARPPKRWLPAKTQHSATFQNTMTYIFIAVKTSNYTSRKNLK
jgi:hypothetical protein